MSPPPASSLSSDFESSMLNSLAPSVASLFLLARTEFAFESYRDLNLFVLLPYGITLVLFFFVASFWSERRNLF